MILINYVNFVICNAFHDSTGIFLPFWGWGQGPAEIGSKKAFGLSNFWET